MEEESSYLPTGEQPPSFVIYANLPIDGAGDQTAPPPQARASQMQGHYQAPIPVYRPPVATPTSYVNQPVPASVNPVNYVQPTGAYTPPPSFAQVACPPMRRRVGEMWTTGLFDCLDDPTNALLTLFAPCVTFGQIAEILDEGRTSCTTSGSLYFLATFAIFLPSLLSTNLRTRIRTSFELMVDPGPDLFVHLCFEYCALCQEYRELKNRGLDPESGWLGVLMMRRREEERRLGNLTPPMPQMMR